MRVNFSWANASITEALMINAYAGGVVLWR